jgi:multidrug efflux system membrane fusion protein
MDLYYFVFSSIYFLKNYHKFVIIKIIVVKFKDKKMWDTLKTFFQNPRNGLFVLLGGVFFWFLGGAFKGPKGPDPSTREKRDLLIPKVTIKNSKAEQKQNFYQGRAHIEAFQRVLLKAEASGTVTQIHLQKGQFVKGGVPLIDLALDERVAKLREAKALVSQRRLEFEASKSLGERSFRSKNSQAETQAKYEAAQAALAQIQEDIQKTQTHSPFDGYIDQRYVEEGDYVSPGMSLLLFLNLSKMTVKVTVPEQYVGYIDKNEPCPIAFVGKNYPSTFGHISFISHSADMDTRTYTVEIEINNPDGLLRDGLTADVGIPLGKMLAHPLEPSALSFNDKGVLGIKWVDEKNKVQFQQVDPHHFDGRFIWATGLPHQIKLIILGQDYVVPGQVIDFVEEKKG